MRKGHVWWFTGVVGAQAGAVGTCLAGPGDRLPPEEALKRQRDAAAALDAEVFFLLTLKVRPERPETGPPEAHWAKKVYYVYDGRGREALLFDHLHFAQNSSALKEYEEIPGNFLAPLAATLNGRNAFHLRNLWQCFEILVAEESARGERYKYWSFSRLDWYWLAPPPRLELFIEADPRALWIPDGSDWDGINDRFALVPRRFGHIYFGRWPWILNGSYLQMMKNAAPLNFELSPKFFGGPEWSLLAALNYRRVPVRRFTPTGAVLCLNSRRARYGRCTRPRVAGEPSFKYSSEASEARTALSRMALGWTWHFAPPPLFEPPCFEEPEDQLQCCNHRLHGVSGDAQCWTDVFDHGRCCQPRHGLWILPSTSIAQEPLVKGCQGFVSRVGTLSEEDQERGFVVKKARLTCKG
ncbi:Uncharacterized protein SCF082_LOCUS10221 [Durusdinium trenchii]|uniref:Uncharacterized protein n=1 Tax=Durusdinium trenchii TaxID=1381693 RepID=A0ABP0J4G3_9DINO